MPINIRPRIVHKLLTEHGVTEKEVFECFANGEGVYLLDTGEEHQTTPPTQWFMAPTNHNRILKICFVRTDNLIDIKTAFEPSSDKHLNMYIQLAKLPRCWPDEE